MHLITGNSFEEVYVKSIREILDHGEAVAPRGSKTFELSPATIVIEDARKMLAMPDARKGNYTFQLAEALWMIRGSNDLEEIAHYNSVWRNFEDEDNKGILNGAYGERLRAWNGEVDQFYEVYQKLKKDPYSRQATMVIFDPERDNAIMDSGSYSKDIPCTNYFNFTIRRGKLNMWTVMRSNDLHKGTIYDIPNFMLFQHILAGWLNVEVGKYTHSAASFHIYESDVENFNKICENETPPIYDGTDYGDPRLSISEFNTTMAKISALELTSRQIKIKENFDKWVPQFLEVLSLVDNPWWKSVGAQIVSYNYRKLGASEEEFKVFLPLITNEYRTHALGWKAIKNNIGG